MLDIIEENVKEEVDITRYLQSLSHSSWLCLRSRRDGAIFYKVRINLRLPPSST